MNNVYKRQRYRKVRHIIWLAVIWSLWLLRNNVIFQGCSADFINVLPRLRCYLGVGLYIRRVGDLGYLNSDWCSSPVDCLKTVS